MAIKTRQDYFKLETNINTKKIFSTSKLVSHVTGIQVQRNKAIVGQNAFAHEAGIHQDGMLKERSTYEIMNPVDIGLAQTDLVLGKHSGRHALKQRVQELGYHLDEAQFQRLFDDFKILADRKKSSTMRISKHLLKPKSTQTPPFGLWKQSLAMRAQAPSLPQLLPFGIKMAILFEMLALGTAL